MRNSILFNTDSYKVSMWKQYPPGTEYVYSYIEARGGIYDATVFFGLQSYLKNELRVNFTQEDIDLADKFWAAHGEPFNKKGWEYLLRTYKGKNLPLRIRAVPEGTLVTTGNVLAVVENTDPKVPWLTTWVETSMLRAIWYGSSIATVSFEIKKVIAKYLELSGDTSGLPFKLHDFGSRGTSSNETAARGGMAHLVNFKGTDTFIAVLQAMQDYNADPLNTAFSIPAAEHSTITSWGQKNESLAYANMVKQFGTSIYAVVGDSYDIYEACVKWGTDPLKQQVISSGGTLVIRPDSGDPVEVLRKCIDIIASWYRFTTNSKGYRVLNTVRFIWGDGINLKSISRILEALVTEDGWSADNFAFGMGGALLNHIQRDDLGWAMKCSAIGISKYVEDGDIGSRFATDWQDVYKNPITAPNKVSKRGRVTLYKSPTSGKYYSGVEDWMQDELKLVYENGVLYNTSSFEEIRSRANKPFEKISL